MLSILRSLFWFAFSTPQETPQKPETTTSTANARNAKTLGITQIRRARIIRAINNWLAIEHSLGNLLRSRTADQPLRLSRQRHSLAKEFHTKLLAEFDGQHGAAMFRYLLACIENCTEDEVFGAEMRGQLGQALANWAQDEAVDAEFGTLYRQDVWQCESASVEELEAMWRDMEGWVRAPQCLNEVQWPRIPQEFVDTMCPYSK